MFKQIPIKKEYLLIAAMVIIMLIIYQLDLKKTIAAWQLHRQLNGQVLHATDLSYQPGYLERKNANLSKLINRFKTDTVVFRSNIISTIAGIAEKENVRLSEVPVQDPLYHTDKLIIQKLDFDGNYFALIKVLDQLQATEGIGMIRSVIFTTKGKIEENNIEKKLMMELYLETIK